MDMWIIGNDLLFLHAIHGVCYLSFCEVPENAMDFKNKGRALEFLPILEGMTKFNLHVIKATRYLNGVCSYEHFK